MLLKHLLNVFVGREIKKSVVPVFKSLQCPAIYNNIDYEPIDRICAIIRHMDKHIGLIIKVKGQVHYLPASLQLHGR